MSEVPNQGLGRVLLIADSVRRAVESTGLHQNNINRAAEVLALELQQQRPFDSDVHDALMKLRKDQRHSAMFGAPTGEAWHHGGKLLTKQEMKALSPKARLAAVNKKAWDDSHD
jgi:hypothetical protein